MTGGAGAPSVDQTAQQPAAGAACVLLLCCAVLAVLYVSTVCAVLLLCAVRPYCWDWDAEALHQRQRGSGQQGAHS
jgi:hypothetical protein